MADNEIAKLCGYKIILQLDFPVGRKYKVLKASQIETSLIRRSYDLDESVLIAPTPLNNSSYAHFPFVNHLNALT